ncbi:hypothetical protein F0562_007635 [Nyssa sinensis]|uniref:Transcriptional coactivator Hfi1/Transcriptional adapter 1 n=1 Tax=Nyssa sinensis TaxID=561372 RepID=A0A5J5A5M0_9ASTE|nr:hypothetical protein F0562_007635 [Nyssa sinensis]
MQPQQNSRIDVGDLKVQIVKKIGPERSKRYFFYLNRLLSQKLSKGEFDRLCFRVLGRENLPFHNQFVRSILKNACHAKTLPPVHDVGPTKSAAVAGKNSPSAEDGHEQSVLVVPNQMPSAPIRSNGVVLPISPRKGKSAIRDRKLRDRPSPLGPNGKADSVSHQSMATEDHGMKTVMENGSLTPCDYQRPMQHPQGLAEQPDNGRPRIKKSTDYPVSLRSKDQIEAAVVEDGEEVEQANHLNISRNPLLAPLGIPFCSASAGGARKVLPVASNGNVVSYFDSGGLSDTGTLRKRMEQIAEAQGLGGVSMECANMLNNMLDVYLKRLIRSCVELVGARSAHGLKKHPAHKQQIQGKHINGMWLSNHLHTQSSGGPAEVMQEQRPCCSISLLDFKVAMELNPQQLGEDWPLLLEKICMHAFEE